MHKVRLTTAQSQTVLQACLLDKWSHSFLLLDRVSLCNQELTYVAWLACALIPIPGAGSQHRDRAAYSCYTWKPCKKETAAKQVQQ